MPRKNLLAPALTTAYLEEVTTDTAAMTLLLLKNRVNRIGQDVAAERAHVAVRAARFNAGATEMAAPRPQDGHSSGSGCNQ